MDKRLEIPVVFLAAGHVDRPSGRFLDRWAEGDQSGVRNCVLLGTEPISTP